MFPCIVHDDDDVLKNDCVGKLYFVKLRACLFLYISIYVQIHIYIYIYIYIYID